MLADLVHKYEDMSKTNWRMENLPEQYRARLMKGIVGFRMEIERLEGKLKLSQNQSATDAARVAEALAAGPSPDGHATARAMRRYGIVEDGDDPGDN